MSHNAGSSNSMPSWLSPLTHQNFTHRQALAKIGSVGTIRFAFTARRCKAANPDAIPTSASRQTACMAAGLGFHSVCVHQLRLEKSLAQ
jgi:hypothetical protein